MPRIEKMPAVASILENNPGANNTFIICNSIQDFAETTKVPRFNNHNDSAWYGEMNAQKSYTCLRNGDMSGVAIADQMLSQIESTQFLSRAWHTTQDVVGAVPNVPAMIAGLPQHMRTRRRTSKVISPLAIVVDLTSSGGINANDVQKRGCAIIALVRLLADIRPVELWASIGLGRTNQAFEIITHIDTTPLDLARAAHMLSHPSVSRGCGYTYLKDSHHSGGSWPYDNIQMHRKHARESFMRIIPSSEILFMPPMYLNDDKIKDAPKWLANMLAQYGGLVQENAA